MKNSFDTYLRFLLKSKRVQKTEEGGYILVVTIMTTLILAALFITTALTSKVDKVSAKSDEESITGFYAAEAGLNIRAQDIRAKFEGFNRPIGTAPPNGWKDCRAASGSTGSGDFACQDFDDQFKAINNQENGTLAERLKGIKGSTYVKESPNNPSNITISDGAFAGLSAQEYRYDVFSTAFSNQRFETLDPGERNQPTSILSMSFRSRLVPLFQFAAFYENDLDFTRPAAMTINGRIHTNHNLFLNSSAPIRINGTLSSALKTFRGEKITTEACNAAAQGSTTGGFAVYDPFDKNNNAIANNINNYIQIPCNGQRYELTPSMVQNDPPPSSNINKWAKGSSFLINPLIGRLEVPTPSLLEPKLPNGSQTYEYWNKADLRIGLRLDPTTEEPTAIEVLDTSQNNIASATNALNSTTCLPTNTNLAGGPYTRNTAAPTITVASTTGFAVGDIIRIASTTGSAVNDFDENVITGKTATTLTLRRPLGKQDITAANITAGVKVYKAIVSSSKTFYNYREKTTIDSGTSGKLIRMLNVDVQGLLTCANSLMNGKTIDDTTEGGLVWHFTVLGPKSDNDVTKTTPDAPNNYGVRLYNGATLASSTAGAASIKGLTIATDQPVYVRGDYNINNKKPAAVLADSLNVLSNSSLLDDSKSCTTYNLNYNATGCTTTTIFDTRVPSETTIYTAFLAGVDIPGEYNLGDPTNTPTNEPSGGFNNYLRLHEGWSGVKVNYRGSMVSLSTARRVNGPFCGVADSAKCNIYSAPIRNWDYDTDFDNPDKLPPLTPRFVYLQQERFSRDFEQQASLVQPNFFNTLFPNFAALGQTLTHLIGTIFQD